MTNDFLKNLFENTTFARSMDGLFILDPDKKQNIHCSFSYQEVIDLFGIDKIKEIYDYGSAIIVSSRIEPWNTIQLEMMKLNIDSESLIKQCNIPQKIWEDLTNLHRVPFEYIVSICKYLNLDFRTIGT